MLAYDYPILGAFFTMMWFFLWVMWIFLLFRVIMDIFRSDDMGGWGKALWIIFVLILPFLGVLVYVIARGSGMGRRDMEQAKQSEESFRAYVREAATTSSAEDLAKLADLRDRGVLTEEEFNRQKAKLLA